MTRSSISIFLLVVGLLWAAVVSWFFVAVGGAGELTMSYLGKALLWYSWLFVGPLLLIVGAVLSLGTHQKAGSILSLVGCAILTLMVGFQSVSMLKDLADPLIMKPPYGKWAAGIILTLLADAGALQLYRLASLATTK
jgi:hypothetical protein